MDPFQSGFRQFHSSESAHLRVFNDILPADDLGFDVLLVMLNLSAAFDTVGHSILLACLNKAVGIEWKVFELLRSCLSERTFSFMVKDSASQSAAFSCGVPQGSVLGPLSFSLYILSLGAMVRKHLINIYTDDCQVYISLRPYESVFPLLDCLKDIKSWISCNVLPLNDTKKEVIISTLAQTLTPNRTSLFFHQVLNPLL